MKIAIAQLDGKWPNLALAKLAGWHRREGHKVDWFSPLEHYDLVYASKIFDTTPDNPYLPERALLGGAGYERQIRLTDMVEYHVPDYSLWPKWGPISLGYTTRGCPRRCPWCVVHRLDGAEVRIVATPEQLLAPDHKQLWLLDPNIVAAGDEHLAGVADWSQRNKVWVWPTQGLDARLITKSNAAILAGGRFGKASSPHRLHLAFDRMRDRAAVQHAICLLEAAGVPRYRLTVYVLVGYQTSPADDLERVCLLRDWGVDPFVMPFDRNDPYQRNFARWCNAVAARKSCSFDDYVQQ